jgi:hypothetical protein
MKLHRTSIAFEKLTRKREALEEQALRDKEIMLAHDILQAYPEMTYGEALRHAFAKLRKEGHYA